MPCQRLHNKRVANEGAIDNNQSKPLEAALLNPELKRAAELAADYLDSLDQNSVSAESDPGILRERLAKKLTDDGVAPLQVMRFDETAYRILGENLVGLTAESEMILSSESYGGRSTASANLPGIFVKDFAFTL